MDRVLQWGMSGWGALSEALHAYPNLAVLGLSTLLVWVLARMS